MHPAVRSLISGNLNIIRTCMAQIEGALDADDSGHPSVAAIKAERQQKDHAGNESTYLDDKAEEVLKEGFADLWKQTQEVVSDGETVKE